MVAVASRAGPALGAAWLDGLGVRALRAQFAGLPAAVDVTGRWTGRFVGPRWWRAVAPYALAVAGLRGWTGKQFGTDGRGATLVARADHVVERVTMTARNGVSEQDGQPALVLAYGPDAGLPLRHVRDELRVLAPDLLLGLTRLDLPLLRAAALPFVLHRAADRPPAVPG